MKKEVWIKLVKRIGNWIVNICFYSCVAFVAWMVLQVFCLTSFKIPSNSMEPALLSGDKILVDKWTGGARLFNIFASLRGEEVDIYRLPGFGSFQRDDVLVFNFPYQDGSDCIGASGKCSTTGVWSNIFLVCFSPLGLMLSFIMGVRTLMAFRTLYCVSRSCACIVTPVARKMAKAIVLFFICLCLKLINI